MYNICLAVFSTSRPEYLEKSLNSISNLNFTGCNVTKILFDDYPMDRNNHVISKLAIDNDFDYFILHPENYGLRNTWQELFNFVKLQNFDYIWHQEDDVSILESINISSFIKILENNNYSQLQLKRNNWYDYETEEIKAKPSDHVVDNYRIETDDRFFWMMSTLYSAQIAKDFDTNIWGSPSEVSLNSFTKEKYGKHTGLVKSYEGNNLVHHFGEYTRGIKANKQDTDWDGFKWMDPTLKYSSRNPGMIYEESL